MIPLNYYSKIAGVRRLLYVFNNAKSFDIVLITDNFVFSSRRSISTEQTVDIYSISRDKIISPARFFLIDSVDKVKKHSDKFTKVFDTSFYSLTDCFIVEDVVQLMFYISIVFK